MFYSGSSLFVAALILSLKTGILLGTSWLHLKKIIMLTLIFSIMLLSLTVVFSQHASFLAQLLDRHTFWFAVLAASLLIFLGLGKPIFTNSGNSAEKKEKSEILSGKTNSYSKKIFSKNNSICQIFFLKKYAYFISFLPCPLCLVALALASAISAPLLELEAFLLGIIISFFFALTTVLTSMGAKKIFRSPTVLNDILFFLGITTLIFAFVIPNITQAATMPLSPISLPRAEELFFTIGGVILIWLLGFFNFKRRWN